MAWDDMTPEERESFKADLAAAVIVAAILLVGFLGWKLYEWLA